MTEIFCVNANTTAVYEYQDLALRSMTVHNGTVYGITATGFYEFTGDDDDGTDIDAHIKTGKMRFGSSLLKRFDRMYVGGNATGGITAQVTTEELGVEVPRSYSIATWVGNLRARREKLSKAAKSRWAQLKLSNVDGGDFKLEQCDLGVRTIMRRIADGG